MKRLLCIVSSLDTGGAETFMMKLFRRFPQEYKLDFVVSTNTGYYENEVRALGGKIFRVPLRTKHPVVAFNDIKYILKKTEYQYILKLCDTPMGYFDLLAAKRGGAKKICIRSCNASSSESLIRHLINTMLRPAFNRISNVKIAPSKLAAEYTFGKKEVKKGNVYFLKNAVDLEKYKFSLAGRLNVRNELGIDDTQIVIGHIGRFNYQKNHMFLLEIFSEIIKEKKNAVLLLVGEGEKKQEISEKAKKMNIYNNIIFTGIRSDIPELLSAMDVFVFPSFFEGMPNTIIEAQAVGIPCVLADTITKEAEITDLLEYVSLDDTAKEWKNKVIKAIKREKQDTKKLMYQKGYDIQDAVNRFVDLIFKR